jgi:hypothetical protein
MGVLGWLALLALSASGVLLGAVAFAVVLTEAHDMIDALEADLDKS